MTKRVNDYQKGSVYLPTIPNEGILLTEFILELEKIFEGVSLDARVMQNHDHCSGGFLKYYVQSYRDQTADEAAKEQQTRLAEAQFLEKKKKEQEQEQKTLYKELYNKFGGEDPNNG